MEKILPYARAPEEIVAGKPLYFATTLSLGGVGFGVLAESHMGRPTKIEGNPQHPASLGAADARTQAEILGLYDPARAQVVTERGRIRGWTALVAVLRDALANEETRNGAGLRILTETISSPAAADQLESILKKFPAARWHEYEPMNRDHFRAGALAAFGEDIDAQYRFERADVVVSLGADVLGGLPGSVRYARDFAARRRVASPEGTMNRLHVAESNPSITGAMADARVPLSPRAIEAVARALAARLGVGGASSAPTLAPEIAGWVARAADDLDGHRGRGVVVAGDAQSA